MTVDSEATNLELLEDPTVVEALEFLRASIGECSLNNNAFTVQLCTSYICAFLISILLNQGLLSAGYLANELSYFATKFIIDFSTKSAHGGGYDE